MGARGKKSAKNSRKLKIALYKSENSAIMAERLRGVRSFREAGLSVAAVARGIWARSSAGRAPRSQCGGREFDPLRVHQENKMTRGAV